MSPEEQFLEQKISKEKRAQNQHGINLGSTIRTCTAEETLKKIWPMRHAFGITRLANITGLDCIGIPVVIAIRPNAKNLSTSQGKGLTLELAQVSALMESIELWHAENMPEADITASYNTLQKTERCIDPKTLCNSLYDFNPFQDHPIDWQRATDMMTSTPIYIPRAYFSMDTENLGVVDLLFGASTNGLASGNTVTEATCHALYEIIERDSIFQWQQKTMEEQHTTLLDNKTIDSPEAQALIALCEAQNTTVYIWDATAAVGVPTYQCALADNSIARSTNVFAGKGAHLNRNIALIRAITEAAQVRLTFISGSRDDIFPSFYDQLIPPPQNFPRGEKNYHATRAPTLSSDFNETLEDIKHRLGANGFHSVIVLNHTRKDFNIPVVHAIVPGMKAAH